MIGVMIILGGMAAFATLVGIVDLLAEREDRHHGRAERRKHA